MVDALITVLFQVIGAVLCNWNPSFSSIIVGEASGLQSWRWRSKTLDRNSYCSYIISLFVDQSSRSRASSCSFRVDIMLISNCMSFLQKSSRTVECLQGSRYTSAPGSCGELETLNRVLSDMGEERNIGTSYRRQENETPYIRVKEKRQVF